MRILIILFCFVSLSYTVKGQDWFYYRNASAVVSKYSIRFTAPPDRIPNTFSVDAPLLGNGFSGISISGKPEKQVFYLARNDFWRLKSSYNESFPCVLGKLELNLPSFKNGTYLVEQDLYTAVTNLRFSRGNSSVAIRMVVSANEDLALLEIKNTGTDPVRGDLLLKTPDDESTVFPSVMQKEVNQNIQWISRQFDTDVEIPSKAACAMKITDSNSNRFNVPENESLFVALAFSSNFKSNDCVKSTIDWVKQIEKKDFYNLLSEHKKWWSDYWNKSFIMINDSLLELDYYRSLYVMGSCSRDKEFPPGIFGTWVTRERPEWNGDYHLNYNHQSPYYGLFSSNRIEQALPYFYPVVAMEEKGREYGKNAYGINGIILPVGIGPKGMDVTKAGPVARQMRQFYFDHGFYEDGGLFFFQKSNALLCIPNMAMLFYGTYDRNYTELVYPFVRGVIDFWEGYLKYENGRYAIYGDAVQEGPNGDFNPILSLGLLRQALTTAIDMSHFLNKDQERIEKWKNILSKLSKFPTYKNNGKILFDYSEKGWHTSSNHANLCQIIFPAGQVHLDSEKNLLETARNTMLHDFRTHEWYHTLHTNSDYPSLVRLGLDADSIYNDLKFFIKNFRGTNGFFNQNHEQYTVGIECCSTTPATLNEMLLRSHSDVIEVFPVWNRNKYALFQDLRAEGAFLVSSLIHDGKVQWIKITSEQGRECNIVNPWDAKTISVIRNGKDSKMDVGKRFTLKTSKNEIIIIMPWNWVKREE